MACAALKRAVFHAMGSKTIPLAQRFRQYLRATNCYKLSDPYLAWAYMEAAQFAMRFQPEAQRFYQRKLAKSNKNIILARKAVAHKLARACYYIMRDLVPFDATKAFG